MKEIKAEDYYWQGTQGTKNPYKPKKSSFGKGFIVVKLIKKNIKE